MKTTSRRSTWRERIDPMPAAAAKLRRILVSRLGSGALAIVLLSGVVAASNAADLPSKFDPSRDAAADIAHAIALARAEGKRVIVDVGGEWCTWCHIMDRFIAANPDLRSLLDARFVWVKVNFSPQNRNEAVLARWPRIHGYPHLFVLDARGKLLHSQNTGELEAGKSYDNARFRAFLERWAPTPMSSGRT